MEFLLVIIAALAAYVIYILFIKKDVSEKTADQSATAVPTKRVWEKAETIVAAFLALNSEDYFFGKTIREYANAIGRSEGSLAAKVRRLRTIEGKPQETSDIGEEAYARLKSLSPDNQKQIFYTHLGALADQNEELELSNKYFKLELKYR